MCGIVGIVGEREVAPLILDSLKRLEYRGYDSAGIATISDDGLDRRRAEGKLVNLDKRLSDEPLQGRIGIGHTRWATHGAPIERNAHPHRSGTVAVVHNGIVENFRELRDELEADGVLFESQTDTETIPHLVNRNLEAGMSVVEAAHEAIRRLRGAFAIAIMVEGDDDLLVGARNGPPLAVGHGDGEMFLGSDAVALAPFTNKITYLEDGDWVVVRRTSCQVFDMDGNAVARTPQISAGSGLLVEKGHYRHFMLKEIHEQPEVLGHTFSHYVDLTTDQVRRREPDDVDFSNVARVSIAACGTAFLAASVAKYWFERIAKLPVDVDVASEFRYREAPLNRDTLALFVSQSGETADTLACLNLCKQKGLQTGAVVNVQESTIARQSDFIFPTLAGPEIGVASTKAFTCQLAVMLTLAVRAGVERGHVSKDDEHRLVREMVELPRLIADVLRFEDDIDAVSRDITGKSDVLYLGRDTNYPLALEGALKLKEISYIHAEGYAAGELKHGPIALIDEDMPVIVIAPHDRIYEKTVSNMQEVAARGGQIILITDEKGAREAGMDDIRTIVLPNMPEIATPIAYAVPVQLLAYYTAVHMGTDVDQPRNLAKSVTVE